MGENMSDFKAIIITKSESGTSAALTRFPTADLMEGEVTVSISHSTMNYKDGLAITGRSPVVRRFPMIPGIDFAGTVLSSSDARYQIGDAVVLNGWGVGETHLGGYAEQARVKADWLLPLPKGITAHDAMAIGTAGYTAMLALQALERHGLTPAQGPVLVTGASGGVGSIAISLLSSAGYTVIASTGRMAEADYLIKLGADEVIERASLSTPAKPLAKERWAGVIDSVGSHTLANALSMTRHGGAVAACGLAQGMDLPTSVAPFILRGVSLLGIDSVMASYERRQSAWLRLSELLDRTKLAAITRTIPLEDVIPTAPDILDGKVRGRLVVTI